MIYLKPCTFLSSLSIFFFLPRAMFNFMICNRLVGATLILVGLYGVLWGKSKELKRASKMNVISSNGSCELVQTEAICTDPVDVNHDEAQTSSVIIVSQESDRPATNN